MKKSATIITSLQFAPGVQIRLDRILSVSLDCYICQRWRRTVVFATGENQTAGMADNTVIEISASETPAHCTPTRHPFPGRVIHQELTTAPVPEIIYRIEFEYEPFEDLKGMPVSGAASWTRVGFTATCAQCAQESVHSTQTNLGRPWTQHCTCGAVLYVDEVEPKIINE